MKLLMMSCIKGCNSTADSAGKRIFRSVNDCKPLVLWDIVRVVFFVFRFFDFVSEGECGLIGK